jgi:hypothetical protein
VTAHRLTLIGKPGCHLCDDARILIEAVLEDFPDAALTELSILDDDALRSQYAEEIPVLLIDERMHAYWRVDADRLRAALA